MNSLYLKVFLSIAIATFLSGCELTDSSTNPTNRSGNTSGITNEITLSKRQISDYYRQFALPAWDVQNPGIPAKAKNPNTFHPTLSTTANPSMASASDATDIRVFPSGNIQAEVHLSLDRNNPGNLLMSANTYTTTYQQGYYVSNDGGTSWFGGDELQNSPDTLGGDPSTAFDTNGHSYIATMPYPIDGYLVQKSTDQGNTWSGLARGAYDLNFDKEMIAADDLPGSPYADNLYAAWTDFSSSRSVKFNRSTDGGQTFSTPITLENGWGQGTNVQTGPNGEVYICWADYTDGNLPADNIGFTKSMDGGATFSSASLVFAYNGIRTGGPDPTFNYTGVNDFPSMAVDKSNGSYRGRIYITYPEDNNGTSVIQVRYSDDKGSSWSIPKTVSITAGSQNFFPWIAVDDVTGWVSVVYYSFDGSGYSTNTYVAYSYDGGSSFENIKVSDVSHTTAPINDAIFRDGYAGDYIGVAAYNQKVFPVWMDDRNGTWQIYVSPVTLSGPPLSVYISGPSLVNDGDMASFSASVSHAKGSVSYQWYYRTSSGDPWVLDSGSTSSTYSRTFYNPGGYDDQAVKAVVNSAGEAASDVHAVTVRSCSQTTPTSNGTVKPNDIDPCD